MEALLKILKTPKPEGEPTAEGAAFVSAAGEAGGSETAEPLDAGAPETGAPADNAAETEARGPVEMGLTPPNRTPANDESGTGPREATTVD
jgi:hypothetical protein